MLTPTARSQLLAGIGLWAVFWGLVQKADSLPFVGRMRPRWRILSWVRRNKATAILLTEIVNFGLHGVENPGAVTFALGGTVTNLVYVLVINPWVCRLAGRTA